MKLVAVLGDFLRCFSVTNGHLTDRHVYLESYTRDSTSTTISKEVKITNRKLLISFN